MNGWEEIYEYLDDVEKACATEMIRNHIPAPDGIGFELMNNSKSGVTGEASMAWTNLKVVLLLPEQEAYAETFRQNGWKVLLSNEPLTPEKFGGEG